jgi:hypothetical protein
MSAFPNHSGGRVWRSIPSQARQHPIQCRSEGLLGSGIVWRRSAGNDSGEPCVFHKVPNREAFADGLGCMFVSSRIQHRDTRGHQERSQWDILSDHEIAPACMLRNISVGHIGSAIHPDGAHQRMPEWCPKPLVGYQDGFDAEAFGRSKHQLLHILWCGVGIQPDSQGNSSLCREGFHYRFSGVLAVFSCEPGGHELARNTMAFLVPVSYA